MSQDPNQEFDRYCELHVNISKQIAAKLRRQQNEQRSKSMYARAASAHYKKLNKDMSITAAALTNEYLKSYKVIRETAPRRAIAIPTRSISAGAQPIKQAESSANNDDQLDSLPEAAKVLRDTTNVQSRLAEFVSRGMNVTASGLPNIQQQQQQQQQMLSIEQQAIKSHQEWQKRNFDEGVSRYNSVQQYRLKQLTNIYASSTNCVPFSRRNEQPICSIDADWVLAERPCKRAYSISSFHPKTPNRPKTPKRVKIVINKLRPWIQEEQDFAGTPPLTGYGKRCGRSKSCGAVTHFAPVELQRDILAANQLEKAAQELNLLPKHKNFRRVKQVNQNDINDDLSDDFPSKDPEQTPDILDDDIFTAGGLSRNFKSAVGRQLFPEDSPVRNVEYDKIDNDNAERLDSAGSARHNMASVIQDQAQGEGEIYADVANQEETYKDTPEAEDQCEVTNPQSNIEKPEETIEQPTQDLGTLVSEMNDVDGGFLPDLVFNTDSVQTQSVQQNLLQNQTSQDQINQNKLLPSQLHSVPINWKNTNEIQNSKFQAAYDALLRICPQGFNCVLTSAAVKRRLLSRARAIEHEGLIKALAGIKTHEDVAAAAAAEAEAQRRAEAARTPDELREIDDQVKQVKKTLLPEEKHPALAVCSKYANHDTKSYKAGLIAELLQRRSGVLSRLVKTGKMTEAEAKAKEFRPNKPFSGHHISHDIQQNPERTSSMEGIDQEYQNSIQNANTSIPQKSQDSIENESDWPDYEDLIAVKSRSATGVRRKTLGLESVLEQMLNGFEKALTNQQRLQSLGFQGGAFPANNAGAKDRFGRRAVGNTWLPQLELEKDNVNISDVPDKQGLDVNK